MTKGQLVEGGIVYAVWVLRHLALINEYKLKRQSPKHLGSWSVPYPDRRGLLHELDDDYISVGGFFERVLSEGLLSLVTLKGFALPPALRLSPLPPVLPVISERLGPLHELAVAPAPRRIGRAVLVLVLRLLTRLFMDRHQLFLYC